VAVGPEGDVDGDRRGATGTGRAAPAESSMSRQRRVAASQSDHTTRAPYASMTGNAVRSPSSVGVCTEAMAAATRSARITGETV
jgi:hypothetical protein